MRAVERLFEQHNIRMKKIASVFAVKSRGTIEAEEFYQEFAVRLLELNQRYKKQPPTEFTKILNFSLHNLACDLLRCRFKIAYFDADTLETLDVGSRMYIMPHVNKDFRNSFLYFYRQALEGLIRDAKAVEIFDWLISNADVVEKIRAEKNLTSLRQRRISFTDVVDAVCQQFNMIPNVARCHLRTIKNGLKQVWVLEGIV